MMDWTGLLLAIVMFFGVLVFRRKYVESEGRILYGAFAIACFMYMISSLALNADLVFDPPDYQSAADLVTEWGRMAAIAVAMSGLIFLIRDSKPAITRFPVLFCWSPLILIPVYALVAETIFLSEVLVGIYELGTLLAALMMFGLFMAKDRKYVTVVSGLGVVMAGFIVMWVLRLGEIGLPGDDHSWTWQLVLAWGAGIAIYGVHILPGE
jgi:hypothetical protein